MEVKELTKEVASKVQLQNLDINMKKTQIMAVANSPPWSIKLKYKTLEAVESFSYLRSEITAHDSTEKTNRRTTWKVNWNLQHTQQGMEN